MPIQIECQLIYYLYLSSIVRLRLMHVTVEFDINNGTCVANDRSIHMNEPHQNLFWEFSEKKCMAKQKKEQKIYSIIYHYDLQSFVVFINFPINVRIRIRADGIALSDCGSWTKGERRKGRGRDSCGGGERKKEEGV